MRESLYSVSQLAAICNVTDQTLRYYDKINLLKPFKVDENNGYRYYSDKDIRSLRIICNLKAIGLSLEEINDYINNDNKNYAINLLEKKRQEYKDQLSAVNYILDRINDRIDLLSLHDVEADSLHGFLKTIDINWVPQRMVAYTRYRSSCCYETMAKRFFELDSLVNENNLHATDARLAIYHDFLSGFNPEDCDLEICLPVEGQYTGQDFVRAIEPGLYASGIYNGEYQDQCHYLASWVEKHGYEVIGPATEIYINSFENTRFPKNYVTKIQYLVKKC